MSRANEVELRLPAGAFRALQWDGSDGQALFLHGLTENADAWSETVTALGPDGPSAWAIDQRGHGGSIAPASGYAIADYVGDVAAAVKLLRLRRPHLVGHSMGARVALVAAAQMPELFSSVTVVDIGPEQWAANWKSTVAGIDGMPASFSEEEAVAFFTRGRPTPPERVKGCLARLRPAADGRLTWRGSPEAWKQTVRSHRSRSFWKEWERIGIPALLVRGGTSNELRPAIAARMRAVNRGVRYEELDGVGHNIPLIAPDRLAAVLSAFWRSVPAPGA